jgi:flagellar FliL protein
MADDKARNSEDGETPPAPAPKGGFKKILVLAGGILLLVSLTAGATLYLSGALSNEETDDEPAAETAKKDKKADKKKKGKKAAKEEPPKPVVYLPLDPPFVVNFFEQGSLRYLQVSMEVSTREQPPTVEEIKRHMPVIRNNLLALLSSQSFKDVSQPEGREAIRTSALAEVQKIMEQQTGKPLVEALYFTSFVMQ